MESNTLDQKLNDDNLDQLERLQMEYEDETATENKSNAEQPDDYGLSELFDLEEILLEAERFGNDSLKQLHPEMGFKERIIEIHSKGTARMLKKNFSILDKIDENPEAALTAMTALMFLDQARKFRKLKAAGEIAKKVDKDEA